MLSLDCRWSPEEDIAMSIDCGEEDWRRLHDIRLNGQENVIINVVFTSTIIMIKIRQFGISFDTSYITVFGHFLLR